MEMPQSIKHIAKPVSTRIDAHSAQRSLVKVESGINGLLPTSWAPPIYSVSLLSKLRFALGGNGLLRLQLLARSSLTPANAKTSPHQQKKPVRGLDNVGFIAASRVAFRSFP